jgi:hypothetical protein
MHRELGVPVLAECVYAGIGPDIGSVATMPAEFYIVDMRPGSVLEHEHQLVLRAVEAAHAAIRLVPHAEVFQLRIGAFRGLKQLAHMAPVHTYIMYRATGAVVSQVAEHGSEKVGELQAVHFT